MAARHRPGRSKNGGKFVALPEALMNTEAWGATKPAERAVLIELIRRYHGTNNGFIGLSARDAAALCNINKDTATRAFQRLQELGFIECAQPGGFSYKLRHAAEWRLTWLRCDRLQQLPSKAFRNWKPTEVETRSERRAASVRNEGTEAGVSVPRGPSISDRGPPEATVVGPLLSDTSTSSHRLAPAHGELLAPERLQPRRDL